MLSYFLQQVDETKKKTGDFAELAQLAFIQYVSRHPFPGSIVTNFKAFLFRTFSVPSEDQSDVKRWTKILLDPFLEIPSLPPIKVHSGRGHIFLPPPWRSTCCKSPHWECLRFTCQIPRPPPYPKGSVHTTKKRHPNLHRQESEGILASSNKDKPSGETIVDVWQYVQDTIPFLDNTFLSLP
jgi:hypothetical protein